MNRVLPNPGPGESQPFVIRPGNLVTVCIGNYFMFVLFIDYRLYGLEALFQVILHA